MSKSTPDDLAVAFRTLPRREQQALDELDDPAVAADLRAELQRSITQAAALLGTTDDAEAVADKITATSLGDWDESALEALRDQATHAGAVIRRIEALSR